MLLVAKEPAFTYVWQRTDGLSFLLYDWKKGLMKEDLFLASFLFPMLTEPATPLIVLQTPTAPPVIYSRKKKSQDSPF